MRSVEKERNQRQVKPPRKPAQIFTSVKTKLARARRHALGWPADSAHRQHDGHRHLLLPRRAALESSAQTFPYH